MSLSASEAFFPTASQKLDAALRVTPQAGTSHSLRKYSPAIAQYTCTYVSETDAAG